MSLHSFVFVVALATVLRGYVALESRPPITLTYHLFEEIALGTPIGNLKDDAGFIDSYSRNELATFRFRFLMQPLAPVELDSVSGRLRVNGRIDREEYCASEHKCELSIDIAVQPIQYFQIVKITLVVEDKNDNAPVFEEERVTFRILESIDVGKTLVLPEASDPDSPAHNIRAYELQNGGTQFGLDIEQKGDGSTALKLIVLDNLDREMYPSYSLRLVAIDYGGLEGVSDIYVEIEDANDNNPIFENETYDVTVTENVDIGSTIVRVQATDPDADENGDVTYSFSTRTREKYGHILEIDPYSGDILVIDVLDFEEYQVLHIAIIAEDGGPNSLPAETLVTVTVLDLNDNAPNVSINTLTGSDFGEASEDSTVGTFVAHFSVVDKDSGDNGKFDCFLRHPNFGLSKLYASEYQIVTTTPLDREARRSYDIQVECIDGGSPHLATLSYLSIIITDINDNAPQFDPDHYDIELHENNAVGRSLLQVSATDRDIDLNSEITFSILPEVDHLFSINDRTGQIYSAMSYDREKFDEGRIEFIVIATDSGSPPLSSSATVTITLLDLNDEPPSFLQNGYSFGVFENDVAGVTVGQVAALDKDLPPFNEMWFSIDSSSLDQHHFNIDPLTGVIRTAHALDREDTPIYHVTVIARDVDKMALSGQTTVNVYVSDRNDNDPQFVFPNVFNNSVRLPSNAPDHYAVTRIRAKDPDLGENAQIQYLITQGNEKGWFRLDENYGMLTTTEKFENVEFQTIKLRLLIKDKGESPRSQASVLNIHVVEPLAALSDAQTDAGNHVLSSTNLTIVISLAVISIAITIVLVVAIVLLYKRTQAKKAAAAHAQQYGQYNCRQEALRAWQMSRDSSQQHMCTHEMCSMGNGDHSNHTASTALTTSTATTGNGKKEVSFSLESDLDPGSGSGGGRAGAGGPEVCEQSMRSTIDSHALRNPRAQSSALNVTNVTSLSPGHLTSRQSEQRQLEVERLMDMLRRGEYETNSVISEEDSCTDSGRGPSVEDNQPRHLSNDSVNALGTCPRGGQGHRDSPDPQVVPSVSNQNTPNHVTNTLSLPPNQLTEALVNHKHDSNRKHPGVILSKELARLENGHARLERLSSDSADSVHSDSELLGETKNGVELNNVPSQLECVNSNTPKSTPGDTPTATWRKDDYSPSNFYASYLDYKHPKASHIPGSNKTMAQPTNSVPRDQVVKIPKQSPHRSAQPHLSTFSPLGNQTQKQLQNNQTSPVSSLHSQYQRISPTKTVHQNQKPAVNSPHNSLQSNNINNSNSPCNIKDLSPVKAVTSPVNNNIHDNSQLAFRPSNKDASLSYSDNTALECTDNGLLYSCADMSEALGHKTPDGHKGGLAGIIEEEEEETGNSSTSGSFVVDPEHLCHEIDKIFFNESKA